MKHTSGLLCALSVICYTFHAPHSLSCNPFLWLSTTRKCSYVHKVTSVVWCQCMQPLSEGRRGGGGGGGGWHLCFWFPRKIVCLSSQYTLIIPRRANKLTILSHLEEKKRGGLLHDESIILLEFQCWLIQTEWELFFFIICFCSEVSVMTFFTWHGWKQCFAFWLCNQWQEARP